MSALHHLTIADAADRIAAGTLTATALTRALLDRIEALNPRLNAYVLVTAEAALAEAAAADAEIAAGRRRGPLHGIPIAVKDLYATAGVRTTGHSHVLVGHVPGEDSAAVARLRAAGAVILGKLATHEFAFGGPDWTLPFPPARNPWNTDHFTGGSSTGSAAAVAAGLCLGALGSDTGGSIRMPSTYCGITGIKPTYGLVSRRGVLPLAFSMDHCGPMAWTARDNALMLAALAGHDPRDPASAALAPGDYAAALDGRIEGLRVGVIRHFWEEDDRANDEVCHSIDAALEVLRGLGASVEDVRASPAQDYSACCNVVMLSEALAIHERDLDRHPERFGWILRDRMLLARFLSAADYVQALRLRRVLAAEMEALLARSDVVVVAGAWTAAPRIDEVPPYYLFRRPLLTAPFNVTGHPAVAVCCGFSSGGLPLGMQIAGRRFDEATVLKVADAYERATPWRRRRPAM
ncbi:MAG: amidase [Alphaproteobacteria bacterium]